MIVFPYKNAVFISILFTVHLWVAMQAREILTPSLEQVGESVLKFCFSSEPCATSLTFGKVLFPITFLIDYLSQRYTRVAVVFFFFDANTLSFHWFNSFYLAFCTSALLCITNTSLISHSLVSALTFSDMFWLEVSILFSVVGKVFHLWTDTKSILVSCVPLVAVLSSCFTSSRYNFCSFPRIFFVDLILYFRFRFYLIEILFFIFLRLLGRSSFRWL